jgi:glycosyltransferase involved in cell wall biosynthesis
MATFNGESYLAAQLESIVGQTRPPDEIIIVDDGSTDGTVAVAERFRPLANLRIEVNSVRLGPIKNFERAAKLATGDLIFFCDQDDVWMPEKIAVMAAHSGAAALLYSDAEIIDGRGALLCRSELADYMHVRAMSGGNFRYFLQGNCVSGHNLMVSRALLAAASPFPDFVMYDQWLGLVASIVARVDYVDQRLCRHRIHSRNYCNNRPLLELVHGKARAPRQSRRARFLERQRKVGRFLEELAARGLLRPEMRLMVEHFARLETLVFDVPLFLEMIRDLESHYPNQRPLDRLDRAFKFCRGARGYWLPSIKM